MMTWRWTRTHKSKRDPRVLVPAEHCGSCREVIPIGGKVLEFAVGTLHRQRCQSCGEHMLGELAPVIPEDESAEVSASVGAGHQASLIGTSNASASFVSAGELTRRYAQRGQR